MAMAQQRLHPLPIDPRSQRAHRRVCSLPAYQESEPVPTQPPSPMRDISRSSPVQPTRFIPGFHVVPSSFARTEEEEVNLLPLGSRTKQHLPLESRTEQPVGLWAFVQRGLQDFINDLHSFPLGQSQSQAQHESRYALTEQRFQAQGGPRHRRSQSQRVKRKYEYSQSPPR